MNRFLRCVLGLTVTITAIAICTTAVVAQTGANQDPLVQVLVNKGILTADDAKSLTGTPTEQHDRLVQMLRDKGVLSAAEASAVAQPATPQMKAVTASSAPALVPTVLTTTSFPQSEKKEETKPPAPTFIPAVAPLRVLQLEPAKAGGLVPDIKLGSGAKIKLYGFFKASAVYDSSSPYGDDFPLPGFISDSGPNGSPEFHLKARASRFGANFEWPDISKDLAITGKLEFDFEGNFSRADNRNISSIRSNMPSLRLAWGRIDYKPNPNTGYFFLAGQDWTPFGSSILPNTLETTGLQIGFGSLYTRDMQMRIGMSHNFGGSSKFTFGPEFAITYPGFGDLPPVIGSLVTTCPTAGANVGTGLPGTSTQCTTAVGPGSLGNQLGYGERQGADSGKPEVQGRLVFQFQADHAKGVAPAQIIFSGMHATRQVLVTPAAFSLLGNTAVPGSAAALLKTAFPQGAEISSSRYGWTAGFQIPTRVVTLVAQYYRGTGLRYYFAGQIYSEFNDTTGLAKVPFTNFAGNAATPAFLSVPSIDGASSVQFGLNSALALTPVPQLEPRAQGGFAELEIPLSRIGQAEPTGRNAGWTATVHYGYDSVLARDVRRLAPAGGRGKGDLGFANLQYKMNQFVTLGYELSYYRTRAVRGVDAPFLPLYRGLPAAQWHDLRSEFSTIFTF